MKLACLPVPPAALLFALVVGLIPGGMLQGASRTNLLLPPGHVPIASNASPAQVSKDKDRSVVTARDREWWAFQPLRTGALPRVRSPQSVRTPIDRFILGGLEEKRLKLNPAADRRTLLRRASFALLGLPPTPEDVAAFERDRSPDAWSRRIRAMLASPRYGERWARHWLDVARFAESSGFEHDYDRPNAYHYRDFVIRALNEDLPYDQFVRWQIAGDEFAPDNPQALMATGFLGAGVFPTQITANEVERTRYDALDDMLATTGTAMLGLTIGCARCHDHKFDPIPIRDYYRMLATFTSTVRSEVDLDLHPEANRRAREQYHREHAPLVAAREKYERDELPGRFQAWLQDPHASTASPTPDWELLTPTASSRAGASFKALDDGSFLAEGANGENDVYTFVADVPASGTPGRANASGGLRALRLEALTHPSMVKGGPGRASNGNIGLSRVRVFAWAADGASPTNTVRIARARSTFEQNSNHLSIAAALDDNPSSGWAVDPRFGTNHAAIFEFAEPVGFPGGTRLEVRLEFFVNARHNIGRPRLSVTRSEHAPLESPTIPTEVAVLLKKLPSPLRSGRPETAATPAIATLNEEERRKLLRWWKTTEPGWRALQAKIDEHQNQLPKPKLTKVMMCGEGYPAMRMHTQGADFFPETYFLQRGSTDQKKEVVTPGFLQVLLPEPARESEWRWAPPAGARHSGRRRTLANWLTDAERGAGHLVARVIVNRLWQHHFGQGLVRTPNDFGAQGMRPTHPELLDWLARELIRGGWRLKPMHELILASAVYQQSATADDARERVDPQNLLFSRAQPRRLEAEAIRDSLLFVSGVLDTNMFGPGTLEETSRRRSIYFTVKRSRMVPTMQAFDAPEPLVSQGARPSTTVAPQALILMNSPQVRSWAAAFAARCAPQPDEALAQIVDRAYTLALNRAPTRQEHDLAAEFITAQEARHQSQSESESRTSSSPGSSSGGTTTTPRTLALIDFAQVVLSLNEMVYVN
jgi:hypothetical protein